MVAFYFGVRSAKDFLGLCSVCPVIRNSLWDFVSLGEGLFWNFTRETKTEQMIFQVDFTRLPLCLYKKSKLLRVQERWTLVA